MQRSIIERDLLTQAEVEMLSMIYVVYGENEFVANTLLENPNISVLLPHYIEHSHGSVTRKLGCYLSKISDCKRTDGYLLKRSRKTQNKQNWYVDKSTT